jgi:tetratricopeptide (TPR) repeat protein
MLPSAPHRLGASGRALLAAAVILTLVPLGPAPHAAPPPATLRALGARTPVDSLARALRAFEHDPAHGRESGEAALLLGRLHYARGEYRTAADAFGRAAARLQPDAKNEARYWAGVSWLAMRSPSVARASLEEVASTEGPRRIEAAYGVALAWDMANRPDRALDTLSPLLGGELGEIGPSVLETYAAVCDRLDQREAGRRARARVIADYPRSMEAAAALTVLDAPSEGEAQPGAFAVEIGRFTKAARARTLLQRARHAGFGDARVIERGEGPSRTWAVQLGRYGSESEARQAGLQAERGLGVEYRLERRR